MLIAVECDRAARRLIANQVRAGVCIVLEGFSQAAMRITIAYSSTRTLHSASLETGINGETNVRHQRKEIQIWTLY